MLSMDCSDFLLQCLSMLCSFLMLPHSDVVMGFVSTPVLFYLFMALRYIFSVCAGEEGGTWRHRHMQPAVILYYFFQTLNNSSGGLQMTRGPYDQEKQSAGWLRLLYLKSTWIRMDPIYLIAFSKSYCPWHVSMVSAHLSTFFNSVCNLYSNIPFLFESIWLYFTLIFSALGQKDIEWH